MCVSSMKQVKEKRTERERERGYAYVTACAPALLLQTEGRITSAHDVVPKER